jgi:hypothetical protein
MAQRPCHISWQSVQPFSSYEMRTYWYYLWMVTLDYASDAHAQSIMGNGVIIVPPHEFEHPSLW